MKIVVIPLAQKKLKQRGIPMIWLEETVKNPDQFVPGYGGRTVYQRRYETPGRKQQLLRVICEKAGNEHVVITAYLTSDIQRYWRA